MLHFYKVGVSRFHKCAYIHEFMIYDFPLQVLAMCFIRKALDYVFTQTELKWLDDIMPETSQREKDDKELEMEKTVDVGFISEVYLIDMMCTLPVDIFLMVENLQI